MFWKISIYALNPTALQFRQAYPPLLSNIRSPQSSVSDRLRRIPRITGRDTVYHFRHLTPFCSMSNQIQIL